MYAVRKEEVRSIAGSALDLSALSALDREMCARSHIIAPVSHGAVENAMTYGNARISGIRGCARLWCTRS